MRDVVEPLLGDTAGDELLLMIELFQKYSTDWPSDAEFYRLEVQKACTEFLDEVIVFVWPEYMHEGLRSILLNKQLQTIQN